ncbi:hypothetical protein HDU67_007765 [Dinochytrium kinnereticum]|nr:hypothetical protein HDU67_007765 [Dinochytrium kinnereticum]
MQSSLLFRRPLAIPEHCVLRPFTRSYALPSFVGQASKIALNRAPKSRNGNLPNISKIYYYEVYRQIAQSRLVVVVQSNNMKAAELLSLKREGKKAGFAVSSVRNSIFVAAANDIADEKKLLGLKPFKSLFVGPCIVLFSNALDDERPLLVKEALGVVEKHAKKALLVGGKLDKQVFSADQLRHIVSLPPLKRMREEILGLLVASGQSLVGVLGNKAQSLVGTLAARKE